MPESVAGAGAGAGAVVDGVTTEAGAAAGIGSAAGAGAGAGLAAGAGAEVAAGDEVAPGAGAGVAAGGEVAAGAGAAAAAPMGLATELAGGLLAVPAVFREAQGRRQPGAHLKLLNNVSPHTVQRHGKSGSSSFFFSKGTNEYRVSRQKMCRVPLQQFSGEINEQVPSFLIEIEGT